jgi:hypothetical protein
MIPTPGSTFATLAAVALVVLTTLATIPILETSASAEPSQSDRDVARLRMREGIALRDKRDLRGALAAFAQADALLKAPTTGYELAKTEVALGMLVEAEDVLVRVSSDPIGPNDPAAFTQARKAAEALRSDVMVRTPIVQLKILNAAEGATIEIAIDGERVRDLSASHRVNPGNHVIVAHAGGVERIENFDIAEREGRTIKLDFALRPEQRGAAPAANAAPGASGDDAPPPGAPPESTPEGWKRGLFYGGAGLLIVGVATGSITGGLSMSATSDAKKLCTGNVCSSAAHGDLDTARSTATVSTISFVVAGIGAAACVTGFVLTRPDGKGAAKNAWVRPYVGPLSVGAVGEF